MSDAHERVGTLTEPPTLEQLVERETLATLCHSTAATFGVGVRLLGAAGELLADEAGPREQATRCERPITYDGRRLAMLVVTAPSSQAEALPGLADHIVQTLELLLFSGHRAHLASTLHLASAESSYRDLRARNVQLQQAYDRLKELDRLKSTFLATMSHELRTPLTSIIGYSEMLASGMAGALNEAQSEFLDTIRAKGDHLLELILTLLDVAKLEQGQLRLQCAATEPGSLARDVLRTVSPAAAKRGVTLRAHIADELPQVFADQARLRQVLLNLLDNAVKFTPTSGCVTLEVAVASRSCTEHEGAGLVLLGAPERAVEFTVRDTGIGIPEAERERIFDAFYQVDGSATREHGGAGLGLSIVKRLVDAHGGTLTLNSAEGRGSEFRVQIAAADSYD